MVVLERWRDRGRAGVGYIRFMSADIEEGSLERKSDLINRDNRVRCSRE